MKNLDFLYKTAEVYQEITQLMKLSFIKKLKNGKYKVLSKDGKNLGIYSTKKDALKRLKQVEYLKKEAGQEKKLDLTKIENFSYSSIMRKINKQLGEEACKEFASIYKKYFDKHLLYNEKNLEEKSLAKTFEDFNKNYTIKIDKQIIEKKASQDLGSSETVAKYLANIIKFTLNKISGERRSGSLSRVKYKISKLNINEIANKKMPASSAMGQSLTFLKHTLFGQDPQYIRAVLTYLLREL